MTRFHQLRMDIKLQPIKKPESLHVICIVGMKILYSPRLSDSTSKRSLWLFDPSFIWNSSQGLQALYQHADHGVPKREVPPKVGGWTKYWKCPGHTPGIQVDQKVLKIPTILTILWPNNGLSMISADLTRQDQNSEFQRFFQLEWLKSDGWKPWPIHFHGRNSINMTCQCRIRERERERDASHTEHAFTSRYWSFPILEMCFEVYNCC